jgi:hypothetical protein
MPALRLLPPLEVVDRWSEIRKELDRAIQHARGELGVDDILSLVGKGKMGIVALEEGKTLQLCAAFEVISYPRRSVLNLVAVGGKGAAELRHQFAGIDVIARELGADVVRCYCRPSVARLIKRVAPEAKQAYVVMEREVQP